MWPKIILLLKISRPPLWIALPLVFCMGLVYGKHGPASDPAFQCTALTILQMILLSFPACLFTFGLNDVHDYASDLTNPRKGGVEGALADPSHHRLVVRTAIAAGLAILLASATTANPANLFFTVAFLVLAYTYSTPPWRLKVRPPLDVISAGIIGFLAPFALGFSFVDNALALPLQAYYFTFCVMGFHAFSTIMDYSVDKGIGDRTFAVAYGKRTAALFPAVIFLCSLFMVSVPYVKGFFIACSAVSVLVAVFPSEKLARYSFLAMFLAAAASVVFWVTPFLFK